MNDSHEEVRALWCRQLSGEQLDEPESQLLQDALREDSDLLLELSSDATSHALLMSLEDVAQTEEDFVQAVLRSVSCQDRRQALKTETFDGVRYDEGSLQTEPASSDRLSLGLPMVADNRRSSDRRKHSQPRSVQWLSFVLALALFLSVGLFFWFQGQEQPNIAGSEPRPKKQRVDQTQATPVQDDQPHAVDDRAVVATDAVNLVDGDARDDAVNSAPQLAANDNTPAASTPENNLVSSESLTMAEEPLPNVTTQSFVTLTKLEDPVWERDDAIGSRLNDEVVRLFGGTLELTFDDGAVVTLEGPVEFQPRTASLLDLRRGQLSATVPKSAIGFTVLTPTSEVVDLGTEFDVSVKDTGASDVVVRKGEIEVAPGGRNGKNIKTWKLVPRGLNRASFYARPDNGKPGPVAVEVQGANGQFSGIISLDGKTAEFRSAETFNSVRERMMAQFEASQTNTQRQWQDFVDSLQRQMRGTMNFNGRQMQFGNLDEVMRLHNQIQNQPNTNAGTPFSGSININGKVIQFTTQEEFEAARRAAFGPAANFGAGDMFDMQRGPR